jgi:Glycine zipper
MKTLVLLSTVAVAAIALSGCDTPQGQNAAGGAVLGGATGALIGAAATGHASGALVGGAVGAATGAMVGAAATPPGPYYGPGPGYGPGPYPPPPGARCAQFYYDYNGNRVCQAYY